MKIIHLEITKDNGIAVLTDRGEAYCGYFITVPGSPRPEFLWRKIPAIPEDVFEYKKSVELTEEQLNRMTKANEEFEKLNTKIENIESVPKRLSFWKSFLGG
jgi:hypothetical protein